jgi:ribonucleoside-diphosphate reductase beta chain
MADVTDQVPEIVQRVERATIPEMRQIDIDDVYVQMDWLLQSRPTPMDLYNRWERQQWATQDLDFSEDAVQWASMEGIFEGIRTELQRSFTLFFVGEQAVTDTLSPLVHGAPDEPSRIFLSTQLVDEARHAVFFSKFFDEVIGISGGLSAALLEVRGNVVGAFRDIFDNDLVEVTERVRLNPHDYGAWVEGITVYHLVVEGMLALTGQKYLLGILREMNLLPGFYSGFTAVARDESRHVNYGVRALMEAGIRDRDLLDRVTDTVFRLLEPACRTVAAPDRRYAIKAEDTPENLQVNPYQVASFSLNSLTKRLKVVGLPQEVLEEVTSRGNSYYEAAWDEYEVIHSEEHPRRYYDRMAAASG